MPVYVWKGRNRSGQVEEGVLTADSKDAAGAILRRQQIQITSLREKERRIPLLPRLGGRVSAKKLSIFTRQFSVMLDAGLPLVQCLEILGGQQDDKIFKSIIESIRSDVESGASLADAMKRHPGAFDNLYVNMVAAGEAGGILDIILQRLSVYIEKAVKLKSQVASAMIYPVAVIVIAAGVVFIILWKVIPVFAQLFAGLGAELPFITRIVVAASNFIAAYAIWVFIVIGLIGVAVRQWYKTYRGRRVIDEMLLRVPIIGLLLRKIAIARFCRTLSTLTASGVPILDAMEIVGKTAGNVVVQEGIMFVRARISEGKDMSTPLMETGLMPPMVVQMISVGEQTGALDAMLNKIADFYEEEVDVAVASMTSMIEPLLMVFLGTVVGGLVIAMYLPIFEMAGNIKS